MSEFRRAPTIPLSHVVGFAGLLAGLLILVLFPLFPSRLTVNVGDIASQTVRAPREIKYNSDVLRSQLQDQRVKSMREVVSYDVSVKSEQLARLRITIDRITAQRDTPGLTRATRDEGISRIQGVNLTAGQRTALLDLTPDQWAKTVDEAFFVLGGVLEEPFSATEVEDRKTAVRNRVRDGFPVQQAEIVIALVQPLVVPTQRVDEAETRKAREKAAASVEPQPQTYAKNQVIVREGDVIDAAKLEALRNAGLLDFRLNMNDVLAVLVVALVVAGAFGVYVQVFQPPSLGSPRRLAAVALLFVGLVLAAKLYLPLVLPDTQRRFLAYVLPVAAVPMVIAALFEAPFAILAALISMVLVAFTALYLPDVSGIVGLTASQPMQLAGACLFGSLAGVFTVHRAERLSRFYLAGIAVAAGVFLGLVMFWLLDGSRRPADLPWIAAASVASGILSSLLAVGLFVLLGSVFGITTRLQLMELAQLTAPLLRRLQDEAPGTFHHSILVANLAERAADLIGADSLLVRVGAYYHDIGKMGRPGFFIENQLSGGNPHEGLDAVTSAHILREHVPHGLELARRHHLPDAVRAFVAEHHGTRLVTYFYRVAAQADPNVDQADFAYDGPRPGTRETAIVMLADSTEAMVRSAKDRSHKRIDAMVESVISERLAEGQLDDCDLTLRDLRTIAESFKRSLRAIYHPRIEYPAPVAAEQERRRGTTPAPAGAGRLTVIAGGAATAAVAPAPPPAAEEPAASTAEAPPVAPASLPVNTEPTAAEPAAAEAEAEPVAARLP